MRVITVARKPLVGTVAETALLFGTSGLNITGSRVGTEAVETTAGRGFASRLFEGSVNDNAGDVRVGRWPSNVILTLGCAASLNEQSGVTRSCRSKVDHSGYGDSMWLSGASSPDNQYEDAGGASRFFKVVKE